MQLRVTSLPGDGIGPEVTSQAIRVLEEVADGFGHDLEIDEKEIGGAALAKFGNPLPDATIQACLGSQAVLLGAVGSPAFDRNPRELRPEAGLLRLRKELGAFANLRPAVFYPALASISPLRAEIVKGTDILIVRELLGGLYFGEPRSISAPPSDASGERAAVNTMRYSEPEVERIARVAFELARGRKRKLLSVDKANVLECSRLWREVVTRIGREFSDVQLSHMYVDSAAMSLVLKPTEFDVVLTENMFGDILSDEAGGVVGSLGLLASASIGGPVGLYEPVHGSAPDIAGQGIANPLGAILSVAMMLRHTFHLTKEAECVEAGVIATLSGGFRTRDLARAGERAVSTEEMGAQIVESVRLAAGTSSRAAS
ncbi:MAG TPA: 3-isopropylmalate dehydrogenase [Terriglobales bacterium]|nr:3-isopropylmalate dehydrogenase [Terriglobales bacterium]